MIYNVKVKLDAWEGRNIVLVQTPSGNWVLVIDSDVTGTMFKVIDLDLQVFYNENG